MQIHELNTFNGTPGSTDFMAIDTGLDTAKISPEALLKPVRDGIEELSNDKVNAPSDLGTAGQLLRSKGNGLTEWADVGNPTDAQTAQAVSDWLDAHPEATTTVQDGSLTLPKFKPGELPFVTPEQFGAEGDGVTDDTSAWQSAVDSGYNVRATKALYKCGQITVSNNITIDCNHADFICTDKYLFDCEGEVVDTISDADYTANQTYGITNAGYSGYSGFAMLRGDNNFEESRAYYRGGFAALFDQGKMSGVYPVDVTNLSIDIIDPITVVIENVGKIEHTMTTDISIRSINIVYGLGCVVKNSQMGNSNGYNIIVFEKCLNCIAENIYINRNLLTPDSNQSYPLGWFDSSYCVARDCTLINNKWHAITTGNIYLCYHNVVDNCKLFSAGQYAYCDHQNGAGTIIRDSVISCVSVAALGRVENCTIKPLPDSPYKRCWLNMIPPSMQNNAVFSVRNIIIDSASDANGNYVGVGFEHSAQVSGKTYYIKSAIIENVKCYGLAGARMNFGFEGASNYVIGDILVDNTNLNIYLAKTASQTNIDISNYILNIRNVLEKIGTGFPWLGYTTMLFNDVNCENCNFIRVYGSFHDLTLRNVFASNAIDEDAKVSNRFLGYGIRCRVASLAFQLPAYVNITDFVWNDGEYRYNVFKSGANAATYGWRWAGSTMQALTILPAQ